MRLLLLLITLLMLFDVPLFGQPTRQGGPVLRGIPSETLEQQRRRVLRRMRDYNRFIQSNSGFRRDAPGRERRRSRKRKGKRSTPKVIQEAMLNKEIIEKYRYQVVNRDYFLFRLRPFQICNQEKKKKRKSCEAGNRAIESGARNISLMNRAYLFEGYSDLSLLSKNVDGATSHSLRGSFGYTYTFLTPLGDRDLRTVVYADPIVTSLRQTNPFVSGEKASFRKHSVPVGDTSVEFLDEVRIKRGETYLLRILLPEFKDKPKMPLFGDQIYAIRVLEINELGVVTFVGKVIWTWAPS